MAGPSATCCCSRLCSISRLQERGEKELRFVGSLELRLIIGIQVTAEGMSCGVQALPRPHAEAVSSPPARSRASWPVRCHMAHGHDHGDAHGLRKVLPQHKRMGTFDERMGGQLSEWEVSKKGCALQRGTLPRACSQSLHAGWQAGSEHKMHAVGTLRGAWVYA